MLTAVDQTDYVAYSTKSLQEMAHPRHRNEEALYELSLRYLVGKDVPKDIEKHYALLGLAAESGQPQAQFKAYYDAEHSGVQSAILPDATVQKYLKNSVAAEYPEAQLDLARSRASRG